MLTQWIQNLSRCTVFLAFLIAVLLSGVSTLASSIYEGCGWFSLSPSGIIFQFAIGVVVFTLVLLACLFLVDNWFLNHRSKQRDGLFWRICIPKWQLSSICVSAAVMFALWIPWLLAFYPASMNWDTFYQIAMYSGETPVWVIPYAPTGSIVDHAFSDHHPFFDTLIYGSFAQFGRALTGDWNLGVFLFVLVQAAGMAISFAVSVSFFAKKGCPTVLLACVYLFFGLMPFVPAYAAAMVKDTLFSWLYVPYFVLLAQIMTTIREKAPVGRRTAVLFIALGLLLCLTKKTGPYIVIPTAVLFAIFYRRSALVCMVQAALSVMLMWVLLPQLIFPVFDVIPGGKQEALGLLFQQTARYVVDYPDDVSQQERDAIDAVIGFDDLATRYNWQNADPVKFWYRYDTVTDSDIRNYFKVWIAQGFRHPDSYVSAWLATSGLFFAEPGTMNLLESTSDDEHNGSELLSRPETFDSIRQFLLNGYHAAERMPILRVLFSVAFYSFLIPMCALFVVICRCRGLLPLLIPVFLSIAACAITPCFDTRYALPLIFTAPLLVCAVAAEVSDERGLIVDNLESPRS